MWTSLKNGYIDIHSHILHGVDDGPNDIDQSKRMLKIAYEENIKTILATPHFHIRNDKMNRQLLNEKLEELQKAAKEISPDLQIVLGNELFFSESVIEALKTGVCYQLGISRYVLVEFHPAQNYFIIRQGLHSLLACGYLPVLAHIERYVCLQKKAAYIDDLIKMGVYMQVNADSVAGKSGYRISRFAKKLLRDERIHFIATDSHNDTDRAPRLKKCVEYISKKYSMEYVQQLLWSNPMKILQNEYI